MSTMSSISPPNLSSIIVRSIVLLGLVLLAGCPTQHQPVILVTTGHLEYPIEAKSKQAEGWVQITYDVNPDGSTSNLQVVDSEPPVIFDKAAMEFVDTWRFQPFKIIREVQRVSSVIRFQIDPDTEEYVPPPL